jgi:hypothetical protein
LTRDRTQNKKLQVQHALIDWRRSQVIKLIHKGRTLNEIAEIQQVDRILLAEIINSLDIMRHM